MQHRRNRSLIITRSHLRPRCLGPAGAVPGQPLEPRNRAVAELARQVTRPHSLRTVPLLPKTNQRIWLRVVEG